MTIRNLQRVERALETLRTNYDVNEGYDTCTTDLLSDLMHYCNREKIDFNRCLASAQSHFRAEIDPYSEEE
jgi:hypothetical protein